MYLHLCIQILPYTSKDLCACRVLCPHKLLLLVELLWVTLRISFIHLENLFENVRGGDYHGIQKRLFTLEAKDSYVLSLTRGLTKLYSAMSYTLKAFLI